MTSVANTFKTLKPLFKESYSRDKMPFKSKAQARLMYAASKGKSDKVSRKVAQKYIKESKGQDFKRLREYLKKDKKK